MKYGVLTLPNNQNKLLIYGVILWVILEELLISLLGLPSMLRYINDVVILFLCVVCICNTGRIISIFRQTGYSGVLAAILLYSVCVLMSAILNGVSVLLFLWAVRNTFRFLAFYMICIFVLDQEDIQRLLQWLCGLQWLNLILALFEYFVLHQKQDQLGGLFGTEVGCNTLLNIYLCFVVAYVMLQYLSKKKSLLYLLVSVISAMLIAALSELKVFYIEIILITFLALLLAKEKKRALVILLITAGALAVGLVVIRQLFPYHFAVLTNYNRLVEYVASEDGGYHLSRLHAFSNINRLFFQGNIQQNLLGFGFGSCEYSSFDFLTSAFYRKYGMYNYRWFSNQMMFLETGYLGVILYIAILAAILFSTWKSRRKSPDTYDTKNLVIIMCIITMITLWYNASVRTECGYLIYFILASAGACEKGKQAAEERNVQFGTTDFCYCPHL